MSDNGTQSDADLLGSDDTTDASADAGTSQQEDTLLGEETKTEPKVANTAAVQAQKNVDHWVNEITSGRKSIEDLPADKQWLKSKIEASLNTLAKVPEIDEIVEKRLQVKEEERAYKALYSNLKAMKLSADQRETLKSEFNDLKGSGLSAFKALEKAAKIAGIPMDQEEQDRMILRQRMAAPIQGTRPIRDTNPKANDPDFFQANDSKTRMAALMKELRS